MPVFCFRFETLLRQRRREEERRQAELARQLRMQLVLRSQLSTIQNEIVDARHKLGGALVGAVDLSRVGDFTRFSMQGTLRGRQLVQKLAELEGTVIKAREVLGDALRQRKALELLRERDHAEWKRGQNRREAGGAGRAGRGVVVRRDRR